MKISVNKKMVTRIIDGEYYIVDPDNQVLHSLNETGTFIFKQLKKGVIQPEEVVNALCEKFETDALTAEEDVDEFFRKMEKKKIVKCQKD